MSADDAVVIPEAPSTTEGSSNGHCKEENGKSCDSTTNGSEPKESSEDSPSTSNGDAPVKRLNGDQENGTSAPPSKKPKLEEEGEGEDSNDVDMKEDAKKEDDAPEENGSAKEPCAATAEQASPVPDDPEVDKNGEAKKDGETATEKETKEDGEKKEKAEGEEKKPKKEPELTSSDALLNKLDEYVQEAMAKNENVERKVLDALLAAINIQVQREPLSVRKLILDKQLVLPNTISFPPSQVVDLLIEHDPEHPLQKVIQKMFPDERLKLSEAEKKERHAMKQNFGAPHMTKLLMDIGQDLVQEATYSDIVHARNLPEVPKNIETYKQVAAQLRPVWESLKKKNEPYKLRQNGCHLCGFKTESRIVMIKHRSTPHFDGKKFQCTMCPEFDTNESRMMNHYAEAHEVVPTKEEPPLRNPCFVCDEDFQLKGQREAHFKVCKRDYQRLRHIMGPKSPDDLCMLNRWLWEKPPLDPTILQQQQVAQQQQQKMQRQQQLNAQHQGVPASVARSQAQRTTLANNLQQAMMQQHTAQLLAQQQQRLRLAQQAAINNQAASAVSNTPRTQNSLIAAMQQHLQRAAAAGGRGTNNVAALASQLQNKLNQQKQQAQLMQQQQLLAAAKQLQNGKQPVAPGRLSASSSAALASASQLLCEICDQAMADKDKYLLHLQGTHKQMKGKTSTDMQQGAPLACSRCRDRFWTYEGLERHLVMSHGLVTSDLLHKAQKKEDGGRCKLCGKQYAFNMLQHLVADHQVKLCSAEIMYSCDVCAFKCQSYQKLEHHLSTEHPKSGGAPKEATKAAAPSAQAGGDEECITLDD